MGYLKRLLCPGRSQDFFLGFSKEKLNLALALKFPKACHYDLMIPIDSKFRNIFVLDMVFWDCNSKRFVKQKFPWT